VSSAPGDGGIDSHAHVWRRPLKLVPGARHRPDYDAPVESYIANLDRNGLAGGLLIQPSFLGTDNSQMLDAVRRYPDRLKAVVVIDPESSDEDLERFETQGAIGVRYNLIGLPLIDFSKGPYPAFHRRLADRGWHVELHREARDLPALVPPLLAQGVKIAIDHFGRPDAASHAADPAFTQVLAWGREPQVWLKASAAYRCGGEPAAFALMPRVLDHFDATRVLWASDWPHTQHETLVTYDATFDLFTRTVTDASVRRRILEQAPAELYP
jgi:predicted TIM-barrel fold metal-dependent hydrolase